MSSDDSNYDYEERAAILEYDGGLSREEAEYKAKKEIANRRKGNKECVK